MSDHLAVAGVSLLALTIVLPIVGSVTVIGAGARFERIGWPVATLSTLGQFALALAIAGQVRRVGPFTEALAGFPAPYGIELVADGISATVLAVVPLATLGVLAYTRRAGPRTGPFYGLLLLLLAGLSGMVLTGDVFNLYVFLEITGLAAYALVASDRSAGAALAGLKYLLMGTVGASLYLFGIGYLFVATGTLNMADLADRIGALGHDSTLVVTAFGLIVAGLVVKIALVPVHTWQPDAYQRAPDAVSALIAALVSTVSAYALARVVFDVFTLTFFTAVPLARELVMTLAAVSVLVGTVFAVRQASIKRMLAYSSVSHFGLVVLAIAIANETAVVGAVLHLGGHAIAKGGLFLAAGCVATATGARRVDGYAGLADRQPVLAGAFAVLALVMVGVPPSIGFASKWYIVLGALEAGFWPVAAVVLTSTLLTLAYFARLLQRMYVTPGGDRADRPVGHDRDGGADVTDNAELTDPRPVIERAAPAAPEPALSLGMRAPVVVSALLLVAAGFGVSALETALEPTLEVVLA